MKLLCLPLVFCPKCYEQFNIEADVPAKMFIFEPCPCGFSPPALSVDLFMREFPVIQFNTREEHVRDAQGK